jgi:hypothetical protein
MVSVLSIDGLPFRPWRIRDETLTPGVNDVGGHTVA